MKNRHLRNGFAGVCLALLAAVVLAGCKSSDDEGGTGSTKPPGPNAPKTAPAGGGGPTPSKPSTD
jgi:hypothetical protein